MHQKNAFLSARKTHLLTPKTY